MSLRVTRRKQWKQVQSVSKMHNGGHKKTPVKTKKFSNARYVKAMRS